jgi:cystathionine beta-lyase
VFGYSRWQNEAFLGAIAHWYASRFNSVIDPQTVVYGPSVIYMVAETIRQWSKKATASWSIPRLRCVL